MDKLSEFQYMWIGHLRRANNAKYSIELLKSNKETVHSSPYRAGLKTREFENTEPDKTLAENIIKPAQTEWTVLKVFVSKKRRGSLILRKLLQSQQCYKTIIVSDLTYK